MINLKTDSSNDKINTAVEKNNTLFKDGSYYIKDLLFFEKHLSFLVLQELNKPNSLNEKIQNLALIATEYPYENCCRSKEANQDILFIISKLAEENNRSYKND